MYPFEIGYTIYLVADNQTNLQQQKKKNLVI